LDEEFQFLRSIYQQPGDDAPRLVYADWLEEHGDSRAEFLRLEVQLHRLSKGAKKRRAPLQERIRELRPKVEANWLARMWLPRNLAQEVRLDLVRLSKGKALIEVRGGQDEIVLLVEGKPVALNWDDCQGSVGQYLVFTGHTCGSDYVRQLWQFMAGKIDEARPLAEQLAPLLALFAPGTYCLNYTPSTAPETFDVLEYSSRTSAAWYYPSEQRNLVCTQKPEGLNEERVALHCEQIRAKKRPIVVTTTTEGARCEFVIDGHHKLKAYNRLGVKPALLVIVRWDTPSISLEEGLKFLPQGYRGVKEYRRMKKYTTNRKR
jgi:uncharacterized protein (TIGR02996 family)